MLKQHSTENAHGLSGIWNVLYSILTDILSQMIPVYILLLHFSTYIILLSFCLRVYLPVYVFSLNIFCTNLY